MEGSVSKTYFTAGMKQEWSIVKPTPQLRWVRPPHTTTGPDRLQQLWQVEGQSGVKHEWREVPLEIIDPATKD